MDDLFPTSCLIHPDVDYVDDPEYGAYCPICVEERTEKLKKYAAASGETKNTLRRINSNASSRRISSFHETFNSEVASRLPESTFLNKLLDFIGATYGSDSAAVAGTNLHHIEVEILRRALVNGLPIDHLLYSQSKTISLVEEWAAYGGEE